MTRKLLPRIGSHRIEILLGLSLLLPILAPSGSGLGSVLLSGLGPLLPAPKQVAGSGVEDEGYREAYLRLLKENATLRARLIAIGEPAKLAAADPAFWERNPRRIEASVWGRDVAPWRGSLVIAAGDREGVRVGMAVTVGETLVGTVARVGPLFSRVRLLTDPGQRIWAAVVTEQGSSEGYLDGAGDDTVDMRLVRSEFGGRGDPVLTAGGMPLVPRGLLVGTVVRLEDMDRDGVADVEVRPALLPEEIRVVHVLAVEEPR